MSYESPGKKPLEDALAKMGKFVSPALRASIERAIASIDHTDPRLVLEALPYDVVLFHRDTYAHARRLVPMIKAAHDVRCYIEAIVLSHGVIQLSLRGLFVMAWQRAVLPRGLEARDLEPYYKQGDRRGDVISLINELERNELLVPEHATFLREINATRNKAAHGVIFGEIQPEELEQLSTRTQHAAVGALQTFQAWFNNARPLKQLADEYGHGGNQKMSRSGRRRT